MSFALAHHLTSIKRNIFNHSTVYLSYWVITLKHFKSSKGFMCLLMHKNHAPAEWTPLPFLRAVSERKRERERDTCKFNFKLTRSKRSKLTHLFIITKILSLWDASGASSFTVNCLSFVAKEKFVCLFVCVCVCSYCRQYLLIGKGILFLLFEMFAPLHFNNSSVVLFNSRDFKP